MSNSSIDLDRIALMFKALGNPHRLAVFQRLSSCCAPGTICDVETATRHCVGELGGDLAIAASTLSHHLKELNRTGLIQMERKGKQVICWVEPDTLQLLTEFFNTSTRR